MSSAAKTPTLRDDWQERRALLAGVRSEYEFADAQLRVLDFLLKRYGDSPAADQPAQFPLPSAVYINQRAVLVHHHLGRHVASGVKSPREAQERMAAILHRMADAAAEPLPREEPAAQFADIGKGAERRRPKSSQASPAAPATSVFAGEPAEVRDARRLRFQLADPSRAVRMRTIFVLGETGTLDDVGLLMDLLALPESPDEGQSERQLLVAAIEKISGTRPRGEGPETLPGEARLFEELSPRASRTAQPAFSFSFPSPAPARWNEAWRIVAAHSLTVGAVAALTIVVGLIVSDPDPTKIDGSAALLMIYGLGVLVTLCCWETRRRRRDR